MTVAFLLLAPALAGCLGLGQAEDEPRPDRIMAWTQPTAWERFAEPGNVTAPSRPGTANTFTVTHADPRAGFEAQNDSLDALAGVGNWSIRAVRVHVGDLLQPALPGEQRQPPSSGGWLHLSATGRLQATFWGSSAPDVAVDEARELLGPLASNQTVLDTWVDRIEASELSEGEGAHARFHYSAILPEGLNMTPLLNELEPTFQPHTKWAVGTLEGIAKHDDGNTTFTVSLATKQALRETPGEHMRVVVDPLDRVRVHQEGAYEDPPKTKAQAGSDLFRSLEALGVITHVLQHGEVDEQAVRSLWTDEGADRAPPTSRVGPQKPSLSISIPPAMSETIPTGRDVAQRVVRASLAAAAIGVVATALAALISQIWAAADPSIGTNPGPFGKVETLGWYVGLLTAPILLLVPLPAWYPRACLAVRSLFAGLFAGYLAFMVTRPVGFVEEAVTAGMAGTLVALASLAWGWDTLQADGAPPPEERSPTRTSG